MCRRDPEGAAGRKGEREAVVEGRTQFARMESALTRTLVLGKKGAAEGNFGKQEGVVGWLHGFWLLPSVI